MSGKSELEVWPGGVLELAGRDAGAFAQAQLMNDVRVLADAHWQWTGWLNPKGRLIAIGALLRHAEDRYWLVLPDYPAALLADELRRYVFRSKVSVTARADIEAQGRWIAPTAAGRTAHQSRFHGEGDTAVLDLGGQRARSLWIGPGALTQATTDPATPEGWAVEDLAHGLPRLREPATHTPQMLGLDRLNAYSVKKGCYPGQEIVARTHFLGQAKRGLRRLHSSTPLTKGQALHQDGRPIGDVLCAASDGARHEALAVLAADLQPGTLRAATGEPIDLLEFSPGLAR